ncbi:MAG: cell division protein FtsL [Pseudomonadota bacterium]
MSRAALTGLSLLLLMVLTSAVAVSYAKFQTRRLFAESQALRATGDEMQVQWRQLQLELATFATQSRVEQLARDKLKMRMPSQGRIRVLGP